MTQHRPRKRFGQHFLHDRQVIAQIVDAISPQPGQTLVEIGPGLGALTLPLLQRAGELHVVEVDRDLATKLTELCKDTGEIHVHCTDALKFDFRALGKTPLRIAGNLPYNISTPLIFHLLDQLMQIEDMVFMLQEEVVDRMIAEPGGKDYGRLSVMVQARCRVDKLFRVPPGAFNPPPQVYSAMVRLTPLASLLVEITNQAAFEAIVRACFNQRRKTLRNGLRNLLSPGAIETLGIDPSIRPEQLTIADFARLATLYQTHRASTSDLIA